MSCKTNKVFIGNIPWNLTTNELAEIIAARKIKFLSVKIVFFPDGKSRGCAFLACPNPELADDAINKIDRMILDGRLIRASEAKANAKSDKENF